MKNIYFNLFSPSRWENKNPELKYVFNNTKFVKTWENKDNFELSSFDINGHLTIIKDNWKF